MRDKECQREEGATDGDCPSIFSRTAAADRASAEADLLSVELVTKEKDNSSKAFQVQQMPLGLL